MKTIKKITIKTPPVVNVPTKKEENRRGTEQQVERFEMKKCWINFIGVLVAALIVAVPTYIGLRPHKISSCPLISVCKMEKTPTSVYRNSRDGNQQSLNKWQVSIDGGRYGPEIPIQASLFKKTPTESIFLQVLPIVFEQKTAVINLQDTCLDGLSFGDYYIDVETRDLDNLCGHKIVSFEHPYVVYYFDDRNIIVHDRERITINNGIINFVTDSLGYATVELKPVIQLQSNNTLTIFGSVNVSDGFPMFQLILAEKNVSKGGFAEKITTCFWESAGIGKKTAKLIFGKSSNPQDDPLDINYGVVSGPIPKNVSMRYLYECPCRYYFKVVISPSEGIINIAAYIANSKFELSTIYPVFETTQMACDFEAANIINKDLCLLLRANGLGNQQIEYIEICNNSKSGSEFASEN